MATIKATCADVSQVYDRSAVVYTWADMTSADTAVALDIQEYEMAAVEFSGTFNSATIVLNGTVLSGGTATGLKDLGGSAISQTSGGWQTVRDQPRFVLPAASGGGGSQSITTTLLLRRKTAFGRS